MNTKTVAGIEYSLPQVYLLQETGIGTAEYAARTAYDSFDKSENTIVKTINEEVNAEASPVMIKEAYSDMLNNIEHSDLLDSLAWVHHHHSVLEHANLTYLIKGTNRGTLQEHARHRIQAITVQSTRYTMSPIINAFVATMHKGGLPEFTNILDKLDFLTITDFAANLEIKHIWEKLDLQLMELGEEEFLKLALSKSNLKIYNDCLNTHTTEEMYDLLQRGKSKRNVGDNFKWIVTDNWKVDMVVTFNLRSLKNYFTLRESGAAYFQIRWLAQEMMKVTPKKYLDLIVKNK